MRGLLLAIVLGALGLTGCVSPAPLAGAARTRVYSLAEFEEALLEEKAGILEAELRRVRYFGLSEETEVRMTPVFRAEYPMLADWMQVRAKARDGDEIWEYRRRDNGMFNGENGAALERGFALVREGRIVAYLPVDNAWCIEY